MPHLASSPRCRPALLDPSLSFCIQGHQAVGMADASGDRHTTSRIVHRPGGLGMADAVHDPRAVAPSGICILPQQGGVMPRDIALPTAGEGVTCCSGRWSESPPWGVEIAEAWDGRGIAASSSSRFADRIGVVSSLTAVFRNVRRCEELASPSMEPSRGLGAQIVAHRDCRGSTH